MSPMKSILPEPNSIRGFSTRPLTDGIIKPFVENLNGYWYDSIGNMAEPFGHTRWKGFSYEELQAIKYKCVVMGILRGTERIIHTCWKNNIDYYYFDHAYQFQAKLHNVDDFFKRRFYSVQKNMLKVNYLLDLNNDDTRRIVKFKERMNKAPAGRDEMMSEHERPVYLVCPPTEAVARVYFINLNEWLNTAKRKINTLGGEIRYRFKDSRVNVDKDIRNADVVVTCQSAIGISAIQYGKPVICDNISMCKPVGNKFDGDWTYENLFFPDQELYWRWIDSLLASQFDETEIGNGTAFEAVERLHNGINYT